MDPEPAGSAFILLSGIQIRIHEHGNLPKLSNKPDFRTFKKAFKPAKQGLKKPGFKNKKNQPSGFFMGFFGFFGFFLGFFYIFVQKREFLDDLNNYFK